MQDPRDIHAATVRRVRYVVNGVSRQPSWVARAALTAFMLVLAIPIFLLFLFALVAAVVVFGVLALVNRIGMVFRGDLPKRDGRQNVRVIEGTEARRHGGT